MLYQLSYASKWDMQSIAPCHTNPFFFNGTIIKGTIAVIDVQERRVDSYGEDAKNARSLPLSLKDYPKCSSGSIAQTKLASASSWSLKSFWEF